MPEPVPTCQLCGEPAVLVQVVSTPVSSKRLQLCGAHVVAEVEARRAAKR